MIVISKALKFAALRERTYQMKRKKPKNNSLVRFFPPEGYKDYPFTSGDILLFLGEIVNMPGHCAIATINKNLGNSGVIFTGYHTDNFIELKEDET